MMSRGVVVTGLGLWAILAGPVVGAERVPELGEAELKPLVEKFHEGTINWQESAYYATVRVPYQKRLGARLLSPAHQRVIAERVARAEADKVFVILASKIRVDADRTMKDITTDSAKIRLFGNVVGRQTISLKHGRGELVANYKVDMLGVGGVTSKLYRALVKAEAKAPAAKPKRPKVEVAGGGGEPEAVVVIDARGLDCRPAVFPRIVGQDGEVLHDATTIDEETATEKGIATYAVCEAGVAAELPSGPGFIVVPAMWSGECELAQCAEAGPVTKDAPKKRRRRRRKVLKASDVVGKLKTDVVVSKAAADKLGEPEAKEALANARVIIVTDTTVGGTEGRLRLRAADLYAMLSRTGR